MKLSLAGFALIVGMGFLVAQQDAPKKSEAPAVAKAPGVPAIRFNPTSTAVAGASGDTVAISASADSKRIASVGGSSNPASGFVSVMEVPSKKELLSVRLPRQLTSVGISSDGKLVAFTSQSNDLKLLEVDSGKTLFSKKLDGNAQLSFAPDGRSLATITQTKTVQIWDAHSGEEQTKFLGATATLRCVAFSPDGKKLAAGGGELKKAEATGTIFVWDVATQRLLHKLESDTPIPVSSVAFSQDNTLVAGASREQVRIWEHSNKCSDWRSRPMAALSPPQWAAVPSGFGIPPRVMRSLPSTDMLVRAGVPLSLREARNLSPAEVRGR
jgi:WD40 repeat protein